MHLIYIYFEALVFFTFYIPLVKIKNFFQTLGDTAEWYAVNGVHFWQREKAMAMIEEQFGDKLKKKKGTKQ